MPGPHMKCNKFARNPRVGRHANMLTCLAPPSDATTRCQVDNTNMFKQCYLACSEEDHIPCWETWNGGLRARQAPSSKIIHLSRLRPLPLLEVLLAQSLWAG